MTQPKIAKITSQTPIRFIIERNNGEYWSKKVVLDESYSSKLKAKSRHDLIAKIREIWAFCGYRCELYYGGAGQMYCSEMSWHMNGHNLVLEQSGGLDI